MAKHKITILPGDGIGKEVIEAAKIVLDEIALDAEYIYGDIGWEFWCKEGNPLPERTIEMLKKTDCCLFGAITSKPKEESEKELIPELQDKGLIYYSPKFDKKWMQARNEEELKNIILLAERRRG